MRQATPRSRLLRIAAGLVLAAFCAPAPVWAADEESTGNTEDSEAPPPAPVAHWYDPVLHNIDVTVDLCLIRPLAGVTAAAGVVLFIPAVILTSPNGKDSMKDAYDRFVREPGEYFATRPLGEF
jgi:hypothetical protein